MATFKHKLMAIAGAAAMTLGAAPAMAQSMDASTRADVQCLALFTMVFAGDETSTMDANAQSGGMVLIGYYLGRLEQRNPNFDLSASMTDVIMTDFADTANMETIAGRCATEAEAIAGRLTEAGSAMSNMAQ